jgi:hypothetical protein
LAERLHLRNVLRDAGHLCMECRHLSGRVAAGWRCSNARTAGVGDDLLAEMVFVLQRCPGFTS